jgi:hypothetical protein
MNLNILHSGKLFFSLIENVPLRQAALKTLNQQLYISSFAQQQLTCWQLK